MKRIVTGDNPYEVSPITSTLEIGMAANTAYCELSRLGEVNKITPKCRRIIRTLIGIFGQAYAVKKLWDTGSMKYYHKGDMDCYKRIFRALGYDNQTELKNREYIFGKIELFESRLRAIFGGETNGLEEIIDLLDTMRNKALSDDVQQRRDKRKGIVLAV